MKQPTFVTILAIALLSLFTFAEATNAQDPHHPENNAAAQPRQPPGMTSMPMMGMMRSMPMMAEMMRMMSIDAGAIPTDHIEGRIAFLRTELKLNESQTNAWNSFADALRASTQKLEAVKRSLTDSDAPDQTHVLTPASRLDQQDRWLSARLDAIRAIKPALHGLYSVLSDDQKEAANDLLIPQLGLPHMAGMPGQMPLRQMPSAMQPGRMPPKAQ